jgi:glycosidase
VTFLDNHDVKERFRFIEPGQEHKFDDQVTLAFGCLYALPGIPCIYYGTELGLSGRGNDEAVREAIWGRPGGFDENNFFYKEFRKIALVRANRPSLRYGRFYFRPISGNSHDFAISSLQPGVLAFSRILNDEETVIVANADGRFGASLDIIVDARLNQPNTQYRVLYSNKATPAAPSAVRQTGTVTVQEVDGGIGNGPLQIIRVVLQPYEVQILGR